MAKRPRYLTASEISKLMNEPDSETSTDSDDFDCNWSESDSSDTEIYSFDDDDDTNVASVDWSFNLRNLPKIKFTGKAGLTGTNRLEREIDFLNLFLSDDIIKIIVEETNSYIRYVSDDINNPGPSSTPTRKPFSEVTESEIRVFLALIMLMGIIRKPNLKMYFTRNQMLSTPFFNEVMARNRFLGILRHMRFTSDRNARKLDKIKPVSDIFVRNFKTVYTPEQSICVDESLFAWKGRLGFRMYIPSKRSRYGIKIYKLCESNSGYIWNYCVYTGKDTQILETGDLYGERVVKTLLGELAGKGYHLYLDRFFVSPQLAEHLLDKKTMICGTVMRNRKGMPKEILRIEKGKTFAVQKKSMNVFGFKDKKKDVLMLTTIHDNMNITTGKKDRTTGRDILKPQCVVDYNKNMGGIDVGDAVMQHYPAFRKTVKWYRKLFFGFLDMSIYNANAIFMKVKGEKLSALEFRTRVIHQIMESHMVPKELKFATPDSPIRLTGRHFPTLYINKNVKKRRRCAVCAKSTDKAKKLKTSYYECKKCNVGLCVDPCFQLYHTQQKF